MPFHTCNFPVVHPPALEFPPQQLYSLGRSGKNKNKNDKLNGVHQFLVYANDVSLLWENINTMKRNSTSKDVGLEVYRK
jgi:hypothetical protein